MSSTNAVPARRRPSPAQPEKANNGSNGNHQEQTMSEAVEVQEVQGPDVTQKVRLDRGEPRETVDLRKVDPAVNWDESDDTATQLGVLRVNLEDLRRTFTNLVDATWGLQVSKETVLSMGEMKGAFNTLITLLGRDISSRQFGE